jgi:hypothetical protein
VVAIGHPTVPTLPPALLSTSRRTEKPLAPGLASAVDLDRRDWSAMGVRLASTARRPALLAVPLALAGAGIAVLVTGSAPAAAAGRDPGLQICLLNAACVTAGQAPAASPPATPPLLSVTLGGGKSVAPTVPLLPSVGISASLPVTVPSAVLPVSTPSIAIAVVASTVPSTGASTVPPADQQSSTVEQKSVTPQDVPVAPKEGSEDPSGVASVATVNGAASVSAAPHPQVAVASPTTSAPVATAPSGIVPAANTSALQAVTPTAIRPVTVSPRLIQHVVAHSVGGVLMLVAACLLFIGLEVSADRRDPKLVRAAQKSEWLRFEDPSKASGGNA